MCNIQRCALLCTSCKGYYFGCFNTMHYSVHYATRESIFLFHQSLARRLTSEQVVSVMDKLSGNNIPESGSISLRNWIFLLIPSPIPELELNWNWLYPVQAELELNWNCHHLNWNWSRNCALRNLIRNCLHGI